MDEKLEFKVIEFNKDAKRIILSHSRIFEDAAKEEERAEKKAATKKSTGKREDVAPAIQNQAASTTVSYTHLMGERHALQDKIRFMPKSKSFQLMGGYLIVSEDRKSVV